VTKAEKEANRALKKFQRALSKIRDARETSPVCRKILKETEREMAKKGKPITFDQILKAFGCSAPGTDKEQ
jgi:hypothetical protein